ncbi:hypothetical protein O2W15_11650 [Modestobacter sp. VKM Ac-2979]|uniref:hypothetical protein n=1 Tax=unclassified Modestobacter TaxID=2643866 RepID=UPI0022AB7218|nr:MULTISPECIES: hypothetical protein [unclassified Modestobacter]MCZ2812089.1 hypothetical protein [Modestobacter sp. VKM Ac-2979]MCZ2843813.1 hypothetical protein [Modestobacter sp. VKM Ac-2980]
MALRRLPGLVAVLGAAVAATGLFRRPTGEPQQVVTPRGQSVQLAGDGLYRFDTVFTAAGNTGVDAVVLTLGVPLLLASWLHHLRGSSRGSLLLTGALGYMAYVSANQALGIAYNPLYLAYVALFSASLFGFVSALAATDRATLQAVADDAGMPHRTLSRFLLTSAAVTALVWLQPLVSALLRGTAPALLDVYTTPVTYSLDLAIVVPAAALAGVLVRRRDPFGYLVAAPLLVTIVMLLPTITLSTVLQAQAGITFTAAEVIGPIAGFTVLGGIGAWLLVRLLRAVPTAPACQEVAGHVQTPV